MKLKDEVGGVTKNSFYDSPRCRVANTALKLAFVFFPLSLRPREAAPERSKTERGSEGPGLALSAGAHTVFLLDMGMSLLLCPGKMFRQGN